MNDNVVPLRPEPKREPVSDAELYGIRLGAQLNASLVKGKQAHLCTCGRASRAHCKSSRNAVRRRSGRSAMVSDDERLTIFQTGD